MNDITSAGEAYKQEILVCAREIWIDLIKIAMILADLALLTSPASAENEGGA